MSNAFFRVPAAINEPVKGYAPGSKERAELKQALADLKSQQVDIPMYIGGQQVRTSRTLPITPPHDHQHLLGHFHEGDAEHVTQAIDAALAARAAWAGLPWQERAAIFLKAAELLAGPYRARLNAATMLGQSKNAFQAEIDTACELIDFFRFNVQFMQEIYQQQPESSPGMWNRLEHRPLEGFVFALTPFNFTSIAGNLPAAPALMGNVVVWKPAYPQIYSAHVLMELFQEAGVPDGVINLIYVDGPVAGEVIFQHRDFAGIHFTGSTKVFQTIWQTIGQNITKYKSYPRIVGETGGKDFILAHSSASAKAVATAITRGAFEYQGQKCSAASRVYLPSNLADEILSYVRQDLADVRMGDVEDFGNFVNAVITETSFDRLARAIDNARQSPDAEIVAGGRYDKSVGYFIAPTVILTKNPDYTTMCDELFGPVVTVYIYDAAQFEQTLSLVDSTSPYALTGAIFAQDRYAIDLATNRLANSAGNFYINDKPTGAVVGQQPFGGARASGTNDKAGSLLNLQRWVSPRAIKETFNAPTSYPYPFMGAEAKEDLNLDKGGF